MIKIPVKHEVVLVVLAIALAVCIHLLQTTPALSNTGVNAPAAISPPEAPLVKRDPGAIATASEPPKLVQATLGGKPVYVLYNTRNDVILVRCYPTYQPSLIVKPMGGQPAQKEGTLTCKPSGAM